MHEFVEKIKTTPEVRESYMTWDMYINQLKEDEYERGNAHGNLQGAIQERIALIRKKMEKGKQLSQIQEEMEMAEEEITLLYDFIIKNSHKSEQELAEEYCKTYCKINE